MKKILICLTALVLSVFALAETPSATMFKYARDALSALADGNYEKIVAVLPFAGASPDAAEWSKFAACFDTLEQSEYSAAVAYRNNTGWSIAVPLKASTDPDTEVFILISADGSTFTGYRYALLSKVENECAASDEVIWNK